MAWRTGVAATVLAAALWTVPAGAQGPAPAPAAPQAPAVAAPLAPPSDVAVPPTALPLPEPAVGVAIDWQVKNRFRLFRDERDFLRHVGVTRGRTVLAAEQTLATDTGGRGWARDTVVRLCADASGRIADECVRDGVRESYLAPADHRIEARLAGAVDPAAQCSWTFEDGDSQPRSLTASP